MRVFPCRAKSSGQGRASAAAIALAVAVLLASPVANGGADTDQTINFTERTGIIKNPGVGYQTFGRPVARDEQFPSSVLYTRLNWSQIEPRPGTYRFAPIDRALLQARSAGQRLAFRIMGFEEGDAGPTGLRDAGYPGYSFSFYQHANVWFPDMNQRVVQQDLANLVVALGRRYGADPSIDSIDIGFVGDWGEFHFSDTNPTPPMPSTSSLNALHDAFSSNLAVPLVTSGTLYGQDVNAFNYAIHKKNIGWRVDCWGDYDPSGWNHMRDLYPRIIADVPNAWKEAPVVLETCGTMSFWVSSQYPWQQALQWAIDNHASQFNNKNDMVPAIMYPAVKEMIAKLGYRFVLTRAQFPKSVAHDTSFDLTLDWTNTGNAPMYFDRRLVVRIGTRIIETAISMKGFLPGTRRDVATINTRDLAPGAHPVQIGLAAAGSQDPDITLAIQGAGPWYNLGELAIGHSGSPVLSHGR